MSVPGLILFLRAMGMLSLKTTRSASMDNRPFFRPIKSRALAHNSGFRWTIFPRSEKMWRESDYGEQKINKQMCNQGNCQIRPRFIYICVLFLKFFNSWNSAPMKRKRNSESFFPTSAYIEQMVFISVWKNCSVKIWPFSFLKFWFKETENGKSDIWSSTSRSRKSGPSWCHCRQGRVRHGRGGRKNLGSLGPRSQACQSWAFCSEIGFDLSIPLSEVDSWFRRMSSRVENSVQGPDGLETLEGRSQFFYILLSANLRWLQIRTCSTLWPSTPSGSTYKVFLWPF